MYWTTPADSGNETRQAKGSDEEGDIEILGCLAIGTGTPGFPSLTLRQGTGHGTDGEVVAVVPLLG